MNELTKSILKLIEKFEKEEISIGCSDSKVFKYTNGKITYFLKIAKIGLLTREYKALTWLDNKLDVPKIIKYEIYNDMEYLLTESLKGEMICSDYYVKNPELAIDLLVKAFSELKKVDIENCPFNVGIDYKLNLIKDNVDKGLITGEFITDDTLDKYNGVSGILKYLQDNKFNDEKCFSHGDTSLPNIFVNENNFIGFIDVGECGIADKWFDLAICEKSIIRNFGKEYVELFYKKLQIVPDRFKIDYYLLMMNLYL